jgi:formamidopyrimidine-DNA glycosylase
LAPEPQADMPELPEVETVRTGLEKALKGQRIDRVELRRGDLRRPFPPGFAKRLKGHEVKNVGRRAKYVILDLDDGNRCIMHLGMSGSFRIEDDIAAKSLTAHDHVVFHLSSGKRVVFNDPRRFGSMDLVPAGVLDKTPPFDRIGIEPLGHDLTAGWLAAQLAGKKTSIKAALLDQGIIAGLGNIYVCEALWAARVSPLRKAASLADRRGRPTEACRKLPGAIRQVLKAAIASGGSSLRNHFRTDGTLGEFQHQFKVYGKEGKPCPRRGCGGTIRRIVQAGRSTFYCPVCQR